MCRLALINREGIKLLQKDYNGIEGFFNYLEMKLGGDGNGYVILKTDGSINIKKGVFLENKTIAEDILKNIDSVKWILYHTRKASVGKITGKNCHPFYDKNGNVICMNGTEWDMKKLAVNNETDTETILKLCNKHNLDIQEGTTLFDSVFIGIRGRKVFANKNKGSLQLIKKDKAIIFASEFPAYFYKSNNIYIPCEHWKEGDEIHLSKLKRAEPKNIRYELMFNELMEGV